MIETVLVFCGTERKSTRRTESRYFRSFTVYEHGEKSPELPMAGAEGTVGNLRVLWTRLKTRLEVRWCIFIVRELKWECDDEIMEYIENDLVSQFR